jgi:peptidoglycan/xylan/chitin deacetylase (PgdA/CDA1 family)
MRVTKRAAAEALVGAPWMSVLRRLPAWRGALVLAYHRVLPNPEDVPFDPGVVSATPAMLDAQLELLTRNFEVVAPDSIERDPDAPGRRVLVTFDDGYRDNHELALPILRRHGVTATFFLTTGFLDQPRVPWWDELAWIVKQSPQATLEPGDWLDEALPLVGEARAGIGVLTATYKALPEGRGEEFLDYCAEAAGTGRCDPAAAADLWMTWEMAREIRDAGMTIGGHGATHLILGRASPEVQAREVEECGRRLEEELGLPMRFFAYPVGLPGTFDGATRRILRDAGVNLAFGLNGGYLRPGRLDPYDVPRTTIGARQRLRGFRALLALPGLFARW